MRAIVYTQPGPPEVLRLSEVPKPVPERNEVLVRNYAAAVAIEDTNMRARPGLDGFGKPKETIPGTYVAGVVEAVGPGVRRFVEGDRVYAFTGWRHQGAYAEYICLPETGSLATMPANMTYREAVAIPNGFLTALPFLRDTGKVRSGQRVLVNGASGAVGTAAVQLARSYGAQVTGVCSAVNLELVRSLGAAEAVNYTREDFAQSGETYDIIFDAVGKLSFSTCKDSLKRRGVYLTTVPMPETVLHMLRTLIPGGKRARFTATGLRSATKKQGDLVFLTELIEAGEIRAVIDIVYPLERAAEAHRYVETGRKRGNVVLGVAVGAD
jgi:NADPH:quinone reductase-like Zn-dependent oxidoreductase